MTPARGQLEECARRATLHRSLTLQRQMTVPRASRNVKRRGEEGVAPCGGDAPQERHDDSRNKTGREDGCMIKVKSRGNETAEQMLRRFKKACEKEGLTKDIKRLAYYEKPREKRRRQKRSTKPRMGGGMGRSSSR